MVRWSNSPQVVTDFTEISRIQYEGVGAGGGGGAEEGVLRPPHPPPPAPLHPPAPLPLRHRGLERVEEEEGEDSRDDTFILGLFQSQQVETQTTLDTL